MKGKERKGMSRNENKRNELDVKKRKGRERIEIE